MPKPVYIILETNNTYSEGIKFLNVYLAFILKMFYFYDILNIIAINYVWGIKLLYYITKCIVKNVLNESLLK